MRIQLTFGAFALIAGLGSIALFAAMGISELAGIAFIVLGAAINRRAGNDDVSFAPLVGPGLAGISAAGRF